MVSQSVRVCMVCTCLPGQNKWDHCRHLTWILGHRQKWDHYKHPLLYHCVFCWGGVFSLDQLCGYQYEPLKGQCVHGLYSSAWAEQVRPLQASYLKTGSLTEVRPLQAPRFTSMCALLGWWDRGFDLASSQFSHPFVKSLCDNALELKQNLNW